MADVTLSATFADGTIITATGFIDVGEWKSADEKQTLSMFPRNNVWQNFIGTLTDNSGSLKGVSIAGVPYRVPGDQDITMIAAPFKNEALASSGGNIRKMTKQVVELRDVIIFANPTERQTLIGIASN